MHLHHHPVTTETDEVLAILSRCGIDNASRKLVTTHRSYDSHLPMTSFVRKRAEGRVMMMIVTKVSGGSEERSQPRAALCLQEIAGLETEQAGPPFKLKREAAVFLRCQGLELGPIHASLAEYRAGSEHRIPAENETYLWPMNTSLCWLYLPFPRYQ